MEYRQDHAITATQKAILKALGIETTYVKAKIKELNKNVIYYVVKNRIINFQIKNSLFMGVKSAYLLAMCL